MTDFLIKRFVKDTSNPNDPETRKQFGVLSGVVGIICNLVLSFGKFFAGMVTSSIAISADAFNNLSDAISSIVTLVCFKTSDSPADKDHPFGYGRIEYISGLIVSIAIMFLGIELAKSSVEEIFEPHPSEANALAITILIISMLIKLWMSRFNTKINNIMDSAAMKAAAFDSMSDVIITLTILAGVAITKLTGVSVDAYSGIIVSGFIIYTGYGTIKETISPLLGDAPDAKIIKEINETIFECPDIIGIHELVVHNYGPGKMGISFHAEVPADKDIMLLHEAIDGVEEKIKNRFGCQCIIHMDPIVTNDKTTQKIREQISNMVKLIHSSAKVYDLRIVPGKKETLIFHVSVPYDMPKTDDELKEAVFAGVRAIGAKYKCIINIDRVYFDSQSDYEEDNK